MVVVQLVQQWLPMDGWPNNLTAVHPAGCLRWSSVYVRLLKKWAVMPESGRAPRQAEQTSFFHVLT